MSAWRLRQPRPAPVSQPVTPDGGSLVRHRPSAGRYPFRRPVRVSPSLAALQWLCRWNSNGTAEYQLDAPPPGAYDVAVEYRGDTNFSGSSAGPLQMLTDWLRLFLPLVMP